MSGSGREKGYQYCCCPATKPGSLTIEIPDEWLLNTTRLLEVKIFKNPSAGEEKIEIGKVMDVSLNADPIGCNYFINNQSLDP